MKLGVSSYLLMFVLVGALGGSLYLLERFLISEAHAQVGGCGQGRNCTVASLNATSGDVTVSTGQEVCLNGATCTAYVEWNGSNVVVGTAGGFTLNGQNFTVNGGGAQAGLWTNLNGTSPTSIRSQRSAVSTTSSEPAIEMRPTNTLDANDLILEWQDGAGSAVAYLDNEGDFWAASSVCAGNTCLAHGQETGGTYKFWRGSTATDVASIAANSCAATFTISITGANFTAGTTCDVGAAVNATGIGSSIVPWAWPSDSTTVTVRVCNNSTGAVDPTSQTYYVTCVSP